MRWGGSGLLGMHMGGGDVQAGHIWYSTEAGDGAGAGKGVKWRRRGRDAGFTIQQCTTPRLVRSVGTK